MKEILRKIIFYLAFGAFGIFWAEVLSLSMPNGLADILLYKGYGFLYIIFIEFLLRYRVKSYRVIFFCGALFGLIVETFIGKVTFFGTSPDALRVWGISPGAICFVILFYHAFFSFFAPIYLAKRVLKFPFAFRNNKWIDYSFIFLPLVIVPTMGVRLLGKGYAAWLVLEPVGRSIAILTAFMVLLRLSGKAGNVIFKSYERLGIVIYTVGCYLYFIFNAESAAHGHTAHETPWVAMVIITGMIGSLLWAVNRVVQRDYKAVEALGFDAKEMNMPLLGAWLFWHLLISITLLNMSSMAPVYFAWAHVVLTGAGMVSGLVCFVVSALFLIKRLK